MQWAGREDGQVSVRWARAKPSRNPQPRAATPEDGVDPDQFLLPLPLSWAWMRVSYRRRVLHPGAKHAPGPGVRGALRQSRRKVTVLQNCFSLSEVGQQSAATCVAYKMAATSLLSSTSYTGDSPVVCSTGKHTSNEIWGDMVQTRQTDTLQSHYKRVNELGESLISM